MIKQVGRDFPLSPTPNFNGSDTTSTGGMTRREYRNELKQAKYAYNIKSAKEGTLGTERMKKAKDVVGIIKDAVGTAAAAKSLLTSGGGGQSRNQGPPAGGYKR